MPNDKSRHCLNNKGRVIREKKGKSVCKPGSVVDSHSSRTIFTNRLKQPTRFQRGPRLETLFGLAPSGVYLAVGCYQPRGALLPHLFTLTGLRKT